MSPASSSARNRRSRSRPGRPKSYVFSFRPPTKAFNLRLTFAKKNASKDEVISALEAILEELRNSLSRLPDAGLREPTAGAG